MSSFVDTTAQKIASGLNLDPDHVAAGIVAALKSFRVTAYAVLVGLTVNGVATGVRDAPGMLAYYKANLLGWVVANVLAPAWRATAAYKAAAAAPPSPPDPPPTEPIALSHAA